MLLNSSSLPVAPRSIINSITSFQSFSLPRIDTACSTGGAPPQIFKTAPLPGSFGKPAVLWRARRLARKRSRSDIGFRDAHRPLDAFEHHLLEARIVPRRVRMAPPDIEHSPL